MWFTTDLAMNLANTPEVILEFKTASQRRGCKINGTRFQPATSVRLGFQTVGIVFTLIVMVKIVCIFPLLVLVISICSRFRKGSTCTATFFLTVQLGPINSLLLQ